MSMDADLAQFQVYHESVFISFDELRRLGLAGVSILQSTRTFIREIIKAEERISEMLGKVYQSFTEELNQNDPLDSALLILFSSEYINFHLRRISRCKGREIKEAVNKLSRCVTLKWIKWRLLKCDLQSSDSFSTLLDDYNRVAVFDTMEDQSLKVACKVMFQLLKPSIIDIKTFDETRFQLVCTQICSHLVSIDVKVSDNIYITKLKTEAEEYLRDLGGWILTNPILPQVKLDSFEKIIFIQNGDLSTRLYEFGPVTNRCLVSFTRLDSDILSVEVFELNSLSKIFGKRIQIYLNLNLITQLDENIFICLNEEMMIQRLEIDTIAREVRFSDSHEMPKDVDLNCRKFIAAKGKEDGGVWFVWSENGKILVCREDFPLKTRKAVDLPSHFEKIFYLDINMNVLINDRIFITIDWKELYELVNFDSLQHMFTCKFECYRTVVLSDGLFLYGNKGSHLLKFNSNGIISSIHTHDTIHNDLKGYNEIFTGASHVYLPTFDGSLILPNTVVAMQQRFCYEHVPSTLREGSTAGYCFDNGSERYCLSLSRWYPADLYDIKSAKLIKTFQMSWNYFQTKPQSLGKDFLVLKDNRNKDLLLFLINYVDIKESIFIRLSGGIRDYFLLKVWRREDNNIHCLGFKDSNFFHITLQESERGYNHCASELPYSKTSDCLVSKKLKEGYQVKGASEDCNNYYEGIDEDGRSHLLECIEIKDVRDAKGEGRRGYEMRCCCCHDQMGERILSMMIDKKNEKEKIELLYSPYECEYTRTVYQMKLERGDDHSRFQVTKRSRFVSSQSAAWKIGMRSVIPILEREKTSANLIGQFTELELSKCFNGQSMKEIYHVGNERYYEGIDDEGRSHLLEGTITNEVSDVKQLHSCAKNGERILRHYGGPLAMSVFRVNARYSKNIHESISRISLWSDLQVPIGRVDTTVAYPYNDLTNKRSFVFNSIDQMFLAESLIGCTCNFHFSADILNDGIKMNHFTVLSHKRYDRKDRGVGGGVEVEVMINSLICAKIFYLDEMMKKIGRPKEEEIREEEEEVIEKIKKEEETKKAVDDKDAKEASTQTEIEGEDEGKTDHHRKEDNREERERGRREEKVFEGLVRVWLKWVMKCFFAVISMLRRSPMIILAIVIILIAIFMSWKRK